MSELHTPGAGGPGVQLPEAHGFSPRKPVLEGKIGVKFTSNFALNCQLASI